MTKPFWLPGIQVGKEIGRDTFGDGGAILGTVGDGDFYQGDFTMNRKMISRATLPGCFILALVGAVLVLLGSGQVAPTTPNEDEVVLPLNVSVAGNPIGNCCPEGFVLVHEHGNPADHNGDNAVCRKVTPGGTITIDNNTPGNCDPPCVPPCAPL